MDLLSVLFISVALAMDSFTVALSAGSIGKKIKTSNAAKIALFFGFAQGVMLIVGWVLGITFISFISGFDHWIAFALLTAIGIKMILESRKSAERKSMNYSDNKVLFVLAIATSIDALAVGLSFSVVGVNIFFAALAIGIITFALSFSAVFIGKKTSNILGNKAELVGGLILIGIGIRILIEHGVIFSA